MSVEVEGGGGGGGGYIKAISVCSNNKKIP